MNFQVSLLSWLFLGLVSAESLCRSSTEECQELVERITSNDLAQAVAEGLDEVEEQWKHQRDLDARGLKVRRGSTAHKQAMMVRSPDPKILQRALAGQQVLKVAEKLRARTGLTGSFQRVSLRGTALEKTCPPAPVCDAGHVQRYRTIDGSCNNADHATWGQAATAFQRFLDAQYGAGSPNAPRQASDGGDLPGARQTSTDVVLAVNLADASDLSLIHMSWGQFITHDLTQAPATTNEDGTSPMCCTADGRPLAPQDLHPQCLPIAVPADDSFYSSFNVTCMDFVRTVVAPSGEDCAGLGTEQLNALTHWLDGSAVYGSDLAASRQLRLMADGLMRTTDEDGHHLLPMTAQCGPDQTCFQAGDSRAEENPQLCLLHTLMVRQHNRLAAALEPLQPTWDDETLFQEARRIVVAQLQHITYNEYLPAMLGQEYVTSKGLLPLTTGFYQGYDARVVPSVANDFATGAFRVGHSQVQPILGLYNENDVSDTSFNLENQFFNASQLRTAGFVDAALRGLTYQKPAAVDIGYAVSLTNYLFKSGPYGADLVALNVQRGREHGLADYNKYRQWCGLTKAGDFSDLAPEISASNIERLAKAYKSVDDIDLYIGCLAETAVGGSQLGPTAQCVVGEQFLRTKKGDRFFYENGPDSTDSSFTPDQLAEIRKSSLARLICDNNDGRIGKMQPQAFYNPTVTGNARVDCGSIPSMDLTAWAAGTESSTTSPLSNLLLVVVFSVLSIAFQVHL